MQSSTGEISPASSFKEFLKRRFPAFTSEDREGFLDSVRNGLLHNGETRKDWKIRIDEPGVLFKDKTAKTRTINRRLFHLGVIRDFRVLCADLKSPTLRQLANSSGGWTRCAAFPWSHYRASCRGHGT